MLDADSDSGSASDPPPEFADLRADLEGSASTVADAPLLDELAELLGPPPDRPTRSPGSESAYAAEVRRRGAGRWR